MAEQYVIFIVEPEWDPGDYSPEQFKEVGDRLRETCPGADVKKALKFALRARKLKKHKDAAGKMWLATYHRATSEERCAKCWRRRW